MRLRTILVAYLIAFNITFARGSEHVRMLAAPQSENSSQGLEGGFWRIDGNFDPVLHLKNVLLKQSLDVTPEVFFADGAGFDLPVVHLEAAGTSSVNIRIALQNIPADMRTHVSKFGMVGLSYRWSWPAVLASIQNSDEIASLSGASSPIAQIRTVHRAPEEMEDQVIRGTWWKATETSDEVIAMGNTSLHSKQVRVRIGDKNGYQLVQKSISLASHSTTLLYLNDMLSGNVNEGTAGDVTIEYTGPSHAVVVSASIEDANAGFSFNPHMFETVQGANEPVHNVTLDAPGLMIGAADPAMLFPVGTMFMPYAVLHNISEHSITATLSLTSGRTPVKRDLGSVVLAPGATEKLEMSRYFNAADALDSGYGHLSVAYSGRRNDLLFDVGSIDQTLDYVFQVMPSVEAPTPAKIFCYWSVEGDTSTMISIWNYADTPQDATLTLYFSGGKYLIPVHLDAKQTYNLDAMTLVRAHAPDLDGNVIPEYIKSGSAMLVGPKGELDSMTLVVSASTYNVRNATCWPICIDCGGISRVSVPNYSVVAGSTAQATATIVTESGSSQETSGQWTTSNPNVATIDGNGVITAVNSGSATIEFGPLNAPQAGMYCYQQYDTICAFLSWFGDGVVTVQKPGGFSVVSDTGNQGYQCYYADGSPAYTGVQRTVNYQLLDTNGNPITANGIPMTEFFSTIYDGCGLGTTPSTRNGPTFGGGKWGDGFVICAGACIPGSPSYNPSCQSTFNHEWDANGYAVLRRTVTFACQSINP